MNLKKKHDITARVINDNLKGTLNIWIIKYNFFNNILYNFQKHSKIEHNWCCKNTTLAKNIQKKHHKKDKKLNFSDNQQVFNIKLKNKELIIWTN